MPSGEPADVSKALALPKAPSPLIVGEAAARLAEKLQRSDLFFAASDEVRGLAIHQALAGMAPEAETKAAMPRDRAKRVLEGARVLAPNLGERMIAARLLGTAVVVRELAPQDLKIEVDQFSRKEAIAAAAYLAFVVGVAHARQMTDEQRLDWRRQLCARPDGDLQAPSWLWRSIVDLAATHEAGYLEHCRRYALRESPRPRRIAVPLSLIASTAGTGPGTVLSAIWRFGGYSRHLMLAYRVGGFRTGQAQLNRGP